MKLTVKNIYTKKTKTAKQGEVLMHKLPSAALPIHRPALPSLEQCLHTLSLGFYTRDWKVPHAGKIHQIHTFFFARQNSCFVARRQVSSPLRQAARRASASWQRWGTGLHAPLCNALCKRSLGHIMLPASSKDVNSCFTGSSPHLHRNNKAQIGDVPLEMLIFTADCCIFHSCWVNSSWNVKALECSTLFKVSTGEMLALTNSLVKLPLNSTGARTSLPVLRIGLSPLNLPKATRWINKGHLYRYYA